MHRQPCATVLTWVFKYSVKAAARGDGGERRPLAVVPSSGRRAGFGAWPADPRLGTFIITHPDEAPSPSELLRLCLPEEPGAKQPPPQEPIKARGKSSCRPCHSPKIVAPSLYTARVTSEPRNSGLQQGCGAEDRR